MKFFRLFAALLLMFGVYFEGWAQVKMDAYSQMVLNTVKDKAVTNSRLRSMAVKNDGTQNVLSAFIEVDDPSVLDELRAKGVMLEFTCGDVTTVSIPVSIIDDVLATKGLTSIQFARTMQRKNDKARQYANVNNVHTGTGLDSPYKGKGVIYGTIDGGIDFNHAAFKDAEGKSRILMAYLPDATIPQAGAVSDYTIQTTDDGKTHREVQLPGYIYSAEYVKNITTGDSADVHGTHTAATAAGSTYGSSTFYGMAPEASLILTDTKTNYDTHFLNGVALTFYEAAKRQMPAVVNLSVGNNIGTHDGTDAFNKALNSLCGEGRIIVTAVGNEADKNMCLQKKENVTILSGIADIDPGTKTTLWDSLQGVIDMWGKDGKSYSLKLMLLNSAQRTVENIYDSNTASPITLIDAPLQGMLSGSIIVSTKDPSETSNGNRNININIDRLKLSPDYKLALELSGESYVNVWANDGYLIFAAPDEFSGYTAGNNYASYSGMVCYDNAISVGSMNSSNSFVWAGDGKTYKLYEDSMLGEVSNFSSYGTDLDGCVHPTVVAPGNQVSSAINSYSSMKLTNDHNDCITEYDEKDGRLQPYCLFSGTSMAAPVVSGVIALWLEKNPHLTPTDVKNIIAMTAVKNANLQKAGAQMGANGMIDAYAGVKSITTEVIDAIANGNDAVVSTTDDGFMVLATGTKGSALVEVFTVAGAPVLSDRIPCNAARHFSLPATSGIYLITVTAGDNRITKKLCK